MKTKFQIVYIEVGMLWRSCILEGGNVEIVYMEGMLWNFYALKDGNVVQIVFTERWEYCGDCVHWKVGMVLRSCTLEGGNVVHS